MTTGASNDIQRATDIARNMVTKWGLSEKMGPLMYDEATEEVFWAESAGTSQQGISDSTAAIIDTEVKWHNVDCYDTATDLLKENLNLNSMAISITYL